jgi:steroid delta-isomerase-like uncharacterized protein
MEATTDATAGSATHLDPGFVEGWSQRFLEAWNALDGEALAELCTDDVVWHDPTLPETAHGPDEVRAFVTATARAFPDFHLDALGSPYVSAAEPVALLRYRMTATMRGTWSYTGLPATGRPIDVLGVDEWTFRGERLAVYRTYFDRLAMARQLGVVPELGSRGDRVMIRLQRLRARRVGRGA